MRTLLKTPKSVTKISPDARHIIQLSNLLLLGVHVDINELTCEEAEHIEYFGMKRRSKEISTQFETLGKMLGRIFGK